MIDPLIIGLAAIFGLAIVAPAIVKLDGGGGNRAGWALSTVPLATTGYLLWLLLNLDAADTTRAFVRELAWVPSLDVSLSFYVDGLSILMALLVVGIGTLVVIYAGGYLKGDKTLGTFYSYLFVFMGAMLGVTISGSLLLLFIFWELTSISSFLLIGYKHKTVESRNAAQQALIVTGGGGLALLAGLVLLGITGGWDLTTLFASPDVIRESTLYVPLLLLILVGAFTKSAQVPFHFWLPAAMAAPTPVSAYLHSATMVKAGIFLLARLYPVLSGTDLWFYTVGGVGAATMVVGAYLAWQKTDLKQILAYSTVSVLGTITMLLGLGGKTALKAAVLFILGHALYKGALFMAAGTIDHETGTRDIGRLRGLRRALPVTFAAVTIAALSKAGLPPLLGFLGKETLYAATLETMILAALWTALAVIANAMVGAAAAIVAIVPFWGDAAEADLPKTPHRAPLSLTIGPALLAALSLILGISTQLISVRPVTVATGAALGQAIDDVKVALWHGFNLELLLSTITIALAAGIFVGRQRLVGPASRFDGTRFGPARLYARGFDQFLRSADRFTVSLQNGSLRTYLNFVLGAGSILVGIALFSRAGVTPAALLAPFGALEGAQLIYEIALAVIIIIAALTAVRAPNRLTAIASLGVIGFSVAVLYLLYSAPDLAMTQFSIETLSVVLIALIIGRLPYYLREVATGLDRASDAVIAIAAGSLMTILVLLTLNTPLDLTLSRFFGEASVPIAQGNNVVNVILVDFRALDTLGEITVLAVASLGVFVLSRLRVSRRRAAEEEDS